MAAISTRVSSKRGIDDELAFLVLFAGSHLVEHVGDVVERGVILGVVTHAIRVDSSAFSASSQKPSPFLRSPVALVTRLSVRCRIADWGSAGSM